MSDTESNPTAAEVARSYFESVTNRDPEGMVRHWLPGAIDHLHGLAELSAPDGVRQWFRTLFEAFPDMRFEVLDLISEGEKAAVRWRAVGTFSGETRFEGMAPTGGQVEMQGLDLLTIRDGLIEDNRAYTNAAELARQLGALPPQGSARERGMIGALNLKTRLGAALRRS